MEMIDNIEKLLLETTSKSAKILRDNAFNIHNPEFKKTDDPVTELDRLIENMIKEDVSKEGAFNFIGEEYGVENNNGRYTWIIDPIDGTKSLIRGLFDSAISIGVRDDETDTITNSCIYDFMRNIAYVGNNRDGIKMFYRKTPISIPKYSCENGKIRVLGNGNGRKLIEHVNNTDTYIKFEAQPISGSIALLMAQTAIGAYDGFINHYPKNPNIWDVVAGYHLLSLNDEFILMNSKGRPTKYDGEKNGFMAIKKPYVEILKNQL